MTEQPFREIQLSGKQMVFLFMASLVFLVVVFLLGVSVGRGVRNATGASVDVAAATDTTVPASMPPPTTTQPGELKYHDQLQGQGVPAGAAPKAGEPPPAPPAEAPAAAPNPGKTVTPAAPPAGDPAAAVKTPAADKTPAPVKPPADPKTAAKPAAKAGAPPTIPPGAWVIQVGAFGSEPNAENLAADLRGKGFSAFVVTEGPARSRYRVRVGPFTARADADQAAAKLKHEGFTPSVQR